MNQRLRFLSLIVFIGLFCSVFAAEPDSKPSLQDTPIPEAAESKDWSRLESLIKQGGDPNATQADGMTALHWAVYHREHEAVNRLLNGKANVNAKTRYAITPLSIACSLGDGTSVKSLLAAGADPNASLPGGETPLMIAARTGSAESIRQLVQHGAEIDATERSRQTALMWAAAEGNVAAVDALIAADANLNASNKSGFNAMMFAAREGRLEVVKRLLAAGVDVNAVMRPQRSGKRVPKDGSSALTMAVDSGHFELAMFLVRNGANPNDERSGYTPLHAISWIRKPNRGEEPDGDPPPRGSGNLSSLQFVRKIVDAGADVNLRLKKGKGGRAVLNPRGATPLLLAAKTADVPLMSLLVELGANPTLTNVDGCTPLMAAAGVGVRAVGEEAGTEPEVIQALEFLLALGLDVNAVDDNKETAMHGAAYRCYPLVINFLAEHGADSDTWNHKNKSGWTPVMIGQGHRPGSFKPSPETVAALRAAMSQD